MKAGLVHHSDRGVQYACGDYIALPHEAAIGISMSQRGNPYDNAQAESFMKTLKYEEVYLQEYEDLADARSCIGLSFAKTRFGWNLPVPSSRLSFIPVM